MTQKHQSGSRSNDPIDSKSHHRYQRRGSCASTSASVESLPRLQRMHGEPSDDTSNSEWEMDQTENSIKLSNRELPSKLDRSKTDIESSGNTLTDEAKLLQTAGSWPIQILRYQRAAQEFMTQPLLVGHAVTITAVLGIFGMGFLFWSPQVRTARAMETVARAAYVTALNSAKKTTLWSFLKFW